MKIERFVRRAHTLIRAVFIFPPVSRLPSLISRLPSSVPILSPCDCDPVYICIYVYVYTYTVYETCKNVPIP